MCTVTVIPWIGPSGGAGVRLACNRDEARSRAAALPPILGRAGERRFLMPVDPPSGGTWIAANDAGLIMTLLNVYARPAAVQPFAGRRSRGEIIPELMRCGSVNDALRAMRSIDAGGYPPFRLVAADGQAVATVAGDGDAVRAGGPYELTSPLFFTSSGLGDDRVAPPRRALFDRLVVRAADRPAGQDAYHRHAWDDAPQLSVCMRRDEARTVSLTVVEVGVDVVCMCYHGAPPDEPAAPFVVELSR